VSETIDDQDMGLGANAETTGKDGALRKLAFLALMSVALGLTIQLLIVVARLLAGGPLPQLATIADAAQGVTWAILVCTGVGIGTSIMRARAQIVGLLGAVCAPVAVAAAKGSQSLVASFLELADQQAVLSLGTISLVRAVEYAVLGYLLGTLAKRGEKRASRYLGIAALVGLVLGGGVMALTAWTAMNSGLPYGAPQIAVGMVNEVLFPIGCALVIYGAQMVGRAFSHADLILN
jgi:hypothetical protein